MTTHHYSGFQSTRRDEKALLILAHSLTSLLNLECTYLFSLGVMLSQLLTGTLPFQSDSLATLMFKFTNESCSNTIIVRANVPLELKRVVDMALQKETSGRYQSGGEFVKAFCDKRGEV